MNEFLLLLRFDVARENAEKQGENALLHFLHLLRSGAITGENADSRAWCKNGINAINPSSLSSLSFPLASASSLGAANARSLAATHSIRYSAEFLHLLRPAGTAANHQRVCFECPESSEPVVDADSAKLHLVEPHVLDVLDAIDHKNLAEFIHGFFGIRCLDFGHFETGVSPIPR